jgi:DNA-binding CsgD family transcriptional regulator
MHDITSDDSGAARTVENRSDMPNEDLLYIVDRIDFGLIRLEKQVIALTVAGYSSREAAKRMGISEPALRLHNTRICDKLRVPNQFELILFALHHQLVDTDEASPSGAFKSPRLRYSTKPRRRSIRKRCASRARRSAKPPNDSSHVCNIEQTVCAQGLKM